LRRASVSRLPESKAAAVSEIKAIYCDVGGVLLTNGWDHHSRKRVVEAFGLDLAEFEKRHDEPNDKWEKGHITIDEYLDLTVFYEARPFTREAFVRAMTSESKVLYPESVRIVAGLRHSGRYTVAMLNNESAELNDYRIHEFGLQQCFECFFSSCYVGLRKPHPPIYLLALKLLQRRPHECVFIDDRSENVAAAVAVGMHGIQFQSPAQLRDELAKLRIDPETA
jgi:putative hydrolase of the HAD superfamily